MRVRQIVVMVWLLLAIIAVSVRAAVLEVAQTVTVADTATPVAVYAGPGETYDLLGTLESGEDVRLLGRNAIGTWVQVAHEGGADTAFEGWVLTGHLVLDDSILFSDVPVNALPDADLSNTPPELTALYSVPIISNISPAMREVYLRGQALGNRSEVITKVGDSVTADPLYLGPMNRGDHELGPYNYLDKTIEFFGPSVMLSVAAQVGFNTHTVTDPFWADPAYCLRNESPLACEYRIKKPSIVFIMFGPNDVLHFEAADFDAQMRMIVEDTLSRGIIPVLSTFSYHPDNEMWSQAITFNLTLASIAHDYQVPLINLWAASRSLPEYGLEGDRVHMAHSGYRHLKFSGGDEARYGLTLRNLLSVKMLDELRLALKMDWLDISPQRGAVSGSAYRTR